VPYESDSNVRENLAMKHDREQDDSRVENSAQKLNQGFLMDADEDMRQILDENRQDLQQD
jgi:hypothetical protein